MIAKGHDITTDLAKALAIKMAQNDEEGAKRHRVWMYKPNLGNNINYQARTRGSFEWTSPGFAARYNNFHK